MTPVTFGQSCFGWVHPAPGTHGVVLCAPVGHEAMHTYAGWRGLAGRLAADGHPTLRFDLPGTGDSGDLPVEADRLAAWLASIGDAVATLRRLTGAREVTLVGLRLGATLALEAAAGLEGVTRLVLLAPVLVGRTYVREMRLLAESWRNAMFGGLPPPVAPGDHLDVVGFHYDPALLTGLAALDLRAPALPADLQVLLFDPGERRDTRQFAQALGAVCTVAPFPGYAAFMQEAVLAQVPEETFTALLAWLGPDSASRPSPALPPPSPLMLKRGSERPVRFGPDGTLFGLYTAPDRLRAGFPCVLVLNTGIHHRVGNGRMAVTLARHLAGRGIATLRMDAAGLGDSLTPPGRRDSPLYDTDATADVVAALDWLQAQGAGPAVLVGICTGAFLGLHAAVADARVAGLVAVNLQRFVWRAGTPLVLDATKTRRPTSFYARAILNRGNILRLLRGQIDVLTIAGAIARRPLARLRNATGPACDRLLGTRTVGGQVARWMRDLAARNVRVQLLYTANDPGLSELRDYFGPLGRRLAGHAGIGVEVLADADHALMDPGAQARFIGRVDAFLDGNLPVEASGPVPAAPRASLPRAA